MRITVSDELKRIARLFSRQTPLYIVGGFVRDSIIAMQKNSFSEACLDKKIDCPNAKNFDTEQSFCQNEDIDITAAVPPAQLAKILESSEFKLFASSPRLGTMLIKGERTYEFTAFREDSYPCGFGTHAPKEIKFTDSIESDAKRRDFKCNAVYYDILGEKIIDPLRGVEDISNHIISTTRDACQTLAEDGLRILRMFRFQSTLGFDIAEETMAGACEMVQRIKDISGERVAVELSKILLGRGAQTALDGMWNIGLFEVIAQDISCANLPKPNFEIVTKCSEKHRLSGLIFAFLSQKGREGNACEVLSAEAQQRDEKVKIVDMLCEKTLYNDNCIHLASRAKDWLKRFKYSNDIQQASFEILRAVFAFLDKPSQITTRFLVAYNKKNIGGILEILEAFAFVGGCDKSICQDIKKAICEIEASKLPCEIAQLDISGDELEIFGLKGAKIGKMLQSLLECCIAEKCINKKENLQEMTRKTLELK